MRRQNVTDILLAGVFGCGLIATAWGTVFGGGAALAAGAAALAGAGAWGVVSLLRLRASVRRVADALARAGNTKPVEPADLVEASPKELGPILGDALGAARRAVVEAELKARELELRLKLADAEREHAQAIIYSISDAVVVTDPFEDVVLANESAAKTFRFELDHAPRTPVSKIVRDEKILSLIREMRKQGGAGSRKVVEHQVHHGHGKRTYKVTLSTVADKAGPAADGAPGVVAVLHDVTHEREISQLKNDFVSNVSHELRTPLASIKAYVELLIDGEAQDAATAREFYEVIQNDANRLGRLIDNILILSRIEAGLQKVNRRPLNPTALVAEAVEVIRSQAQRKRIDVRANLDATACEALADRDMLYQSVLNLLANAVKYTSENGAVSVETAVDPARRKVIARVTDTGVGIPQKDLPFIFDKFYRSEANSRLAKGTGLGLSLVKHIVEVVHHGRVFVDSQPGKGSCFGFELDLL